ncbi:MAG: GGDEF domain-containing protein [Nitrospirae bacterium]|nr:GGDEF domain-containing protein [Nitrospirota bacterium]
MDDETTTGSVHLARRRMDSINYHLACLVIVAGPRLGERFPLAKDRTVIGRQKGADVSIDDTLISRKHAEVVRKPDGAVVLHDLDSKNGTFCNDEQIREAGLKEGDLIRIGSAMIQYVGPSHFEPPGVDEASERSRRDGLTGFFNKQTFRIYLDHNLTRCKNLHSPLSVGLIDLDGFKKINDGRGHPAGDHVLRELAGLVKNAVRPTDVLARYDDDAFGLILPLTNLMGARVVGERLRNRVADHAFVFDGQRLPVTISVGMAERRGGTEEADALIFRAEKAIGQAKQMGRNLTYCYMDPV